MISFRNEDQNKSAVTKVSTPDAVIFSDIVPLLTDIEKKVLEVLLNKTGTQMTSAVGVSGDNVLLLAVLNKYLNLAEILLKAGANVYVKHTGLEQSLLSYAAERGLDEVVSLFIRYGCDRFLADKEEKALRGAIIFDKSTTIEILLSHRPYDPSKDRVSFIHAAGRNSKLLIRMMTAASCSEQTLIQACNKALLYYNEEATKLLLAAMQQASRVEVLSKIEISKCDKKTLQLIKRLKKTEFGNLLPVIPEPAPRIIYQMGNLSLVDVTYALFEIAANSAIGKQHKAYGLQMTADTSGLYSPLSKDDIRSELRHQNNSIGSIGYLYLGIPIVSTQALDITDYLKSFNLSADEVMNELNMKQHKNSHFPPSFIFSMNTQDNRLEVATNLSKIEEKLTILLGTTCRLMNLYTDNYVIQLSSKTSNDALQQYASQLISLGINAEASPASSCCGGLVKIPPKLSFRSSLDDVLTKLHSIKQDLPSATTRVQL